VDSSICILGLDRKVFVRYLKTHILLFILDSKNFEQIKNSLNLICFENRTSTFEEKN
jgi:hypothetical protein